MLRGIVYITVSQRDNIFIVPILLFHINGKDFIAKTIPGINCIKCLRIYCLYLLNLNALNLPKSRSLCSSFSAYNFYQ